MGMGFDNNFKDRYKRQQRRTVFGFFGFILMYLAIIVALAFVLEMLMEDVKDKHCKEGWAQCIGKSLSETKSNFDKGLKDGRADKTK